MTPTLPSPHLVTDSSPFYSTSFQLESELSVSQTLTSELKVNTFDPLPLPSSQLEDLPFHSSFLSKELVVFPSSPLKRKRTSFSCSSSASSSVHGSTPSAQKWEDGRSSPSFKKTRRILSTPWLVRKSQLKKKDPPYHASTLLLDDACMLNNCFFFFFFLS
ncbi:hypothetical protein HMI56_000582 [Coelomomyces lativittatus]|nr:hypothetical protein HMI56_000582 [Coelomomyces lativittatus]